MNGTKAWLIKRPDGRFLELDSGHWSWSSNAVRSLQYPTRQQAEQAMQCARNCGVDWPGMCVVEREFRKMELS